MAELNLRFGLNLKSIDCDIDALANLLPQDGIKRVRAKQSYRWPEEFFSSSIGYCYSYSSILDIDEPCADFILKWSNGKKVLQHFHDLGFTFHLTFEFIINDWNFPAIVFEKDFIDFTSLHNITFGMYFWSGDDKYNGV
jgi:hypothetical protein